jgi:hypothetical protein
MTKPPESAAQIAQRAVTVLAGAGDRSTEAVVEMLDILAADHYPRYGGAVRHLGDLLDGNGKGGNPGRSGDDELVDRIIALGIRRGGSLGDFELALREVAKEEAKAGRGTLRANLRRLRPKVERAL